MLIAYPVVFIEEENGYSAIFPDLNHLSTCGDTLYETVEMAIECFNDFLDSSTFDKENINKPSDVKDIDLVSIAKEFETKPENCIISSIVFDIDKYTKEINK